MVRLSAYASLEIVMVYNPTGVPLHDRTVQGLNLICRQGSIDELLNLGSTNSSLILFVMSPAQFLHDLSALNGFVGQKNSLQENMGVFLVDDPSQPATLRAWKKIAAAASSGLLVGQLRAAFSINQFMQELDKAVQHLFLSANRAVFDSMMAIRDVEARSIHEIGIAMMSGQSSIDELLHLVLEKAIDISHADAGFLFLRENLLAEHSVDSDDINLVRRIGNRFVQKHRVCRSQNIRLPAHFGDPQRSPFTATVANRPCGMAWSAESGRTVFHALDDYPAGETEVPDPEFGIDKRAYAVRSWCVFPLRTPGCAVVGFLLLINRRISATVFCDSVTECEKYVAEFNGHDLNILSALANQAGISIDHARLYRDLRTLFESFVQASVVAIESRDPTTKGHSDRVAVMTLGLAEAVNRVTNGPYGSISFNPSQLYELRYAALLHDFGKIGVQESVLRKEKKLYPEELIVLRERFSTAQHRLQFDLLRAYIESLMAKGEAPSQVDYARIQREISSISKDFSALWEAVSEANEPTIIAQDAFQKIAGIRILMGDRDTELISEREFKRLSLDRGSLSPEERMEIESHVEHSYRFLIKIPWSSDLANIPDIVYAHHERLDGSGYPRGLVDANEPIPIQAKIMAIADVYDALVSVDRPYKKAIPQQRAFNILETEVREGKLDPHLFTIFVQSRIADMVLYPESDVA